jgi:dihydrolipoamide dehydrogenase
MKKKFDIAVIGSGPGGIAAALRAASLGRKVAVIEKGELGGVCLNTGCIPTKTIIASVSLYSQIKRAGDLGISAQEPKIEWDKVLERKNRVISKLRKGIELSFKKAGIEVIKGTGAVKGPGAVGTGSDEISCEKIIIATGTEKQLLPGFKNALTSDEVLELKEIPSSMAIIGGGAVGVEFASIFAALGTIVTIYEMEPSILPGMDKDIAAEAAKSLEKSGITILAGSPADPEKISAGTVLTTGRRFKKIEVDRSMETGEKGIYAVGDVTGIANYAHTATMQGITAADNACGTKREMDYTAVPSCLFTDPEVASVGMTQQAAEDAGIDIAASKFHFAALGRSACSGDLRGFVKLIAEKKTGSVIGCHIIGQHASDIIQEAVTAVRHNMTAADLANTIHAHPTLPEGVWEAARAL